MHRSIRLSLLASAVVLGSTAFAASGGAAAPVAALGPTSTNPYFSLKPGLRFEYAHGTHTEIVTVLDRTETIAGVQTRVIEDREWVKGQLVEASLDYYAGDPRTGDVYYFGEDSAEYKNGKVVSRQGSWRAGAHGAHQGLMMPGRPTVGQTYAIANAPGADMGRAKIVSTDQSVKVPAGAFRQCVDVRTTDATEPGVVEHHAYSREVGGAAKDAGMELVRFTRPN